MSKAGLGQRERTPLLFSGTFPSGKAGPSLIHRLAFAARWKPRIKLELMSSGVRMRLSWEQPIAQACRVVEAPFPLLIGSGLLDALDSTALERDFPAYSGAGFFPHDDADCGPSFNALVDALHTPAFTDALGERLAIEHLSQYPALVTVCRSLNRRHGTIHTDSESKIATLLLYLNPAWREASAGCLRFLAAPDDIGSMLVPEIRPLYGNFVAFRRTENSFHGHLPFEGERRVIQVAWLRDVAALERKGRRGRLSRTVKRLAGRLDHWLGRNRDPNKRHP
jgi:hypothetical protein